MFDTGEVVEEDASAHSEDSDNKSEKNDDVSKASDAGGSKTQTHKYVRYNGSIACCQSGYHCLHTSHKTCL